MRKIELFHNFIQYTFWNKAFELTIIKDAALRCSGPALQPCQESGGLEGAWFGHRSRVAHMLFKWV